MASSLASRLKWGFLVLLAAFIFAFYGLISLQELSLTSLYLNFAPKAGAAILLVLAGKAIIELTSPLVDRVVRRAETRDAAHRAWALAVWSATAFTVVAVAIGDYSAMIIAFGLIILGTALAFRKPLLSLVGWLNITSRRLYAKGDIIECGGFSGEVADIGLVSTSIWEFRPGEPGQTGRTVSLPNSFAFEHPLTVMRRGDQHVWDELTLSLPLKADYRKARTILLKACDEAIGAKKMAGNAGEQQSTLKDAGLSSKVLSEPEVYIILNGDSVDLRLRYLVEASQRSEAKSAISEHALLLMAKEGPKLKS